MNVTVYPGELRGTVAAPPSKSHAHRLLIAAALAREETVIRCPELNADLEATLRCLQALGAGVEQEGETLRVRGVERETGVARLDCDQSGSTLRFLAPLCASLNRTIHLTGAGRLPLRPIRPLLQTLAQNGARIQGDALPLTLDGGLQPGDFLLPGGESSQYFSGLLLALPRLNGDSTVRFLPPLVSAPYVDMTLDVLAQFGIFVESVDNGWRIPGKQRYRSPGVVEAEGDWSAAGNWLAAQTMGNSIQITGLRSASRQGDRQLPELLRHVGETIDLTATPDVMPILAMMAACCPGRETRLTGIARLRQKESDRVAAMIAAIRALGGWAQADADAMQIRGQRLLGGWADGASDHRIVMALAVGATGCAEPVVISGAEAVRKSYPRFWQDFEALGGKVRYGAAG